MKWIVAAVALAALAFAFLSRGDPVKTSYVNGLPQYNHLPGKEFIFQRDCYLFKFEDENTSWPLVGSNEVVPDLPRVVSPDEIGRIHGRARIIGVVRVGERVRLASVRRQEGGGKPPLISFELLFTDEAKREEPRMDALLILDRTLEASGGAPTLREDYAVPRIKA